MNGFVDRCDENKERKKKITNYVEYQRAFFSSNEVSLGVII